jgi:hypothetical protein
VIFKSTLPSKRLVDLSAGEFRLLLNIPDPGYCIVSKPFVATPGDLLLRVFGLTKPVSAPGLDSCLICVPKSAFVEPERPQWVDLSPSLIVNYRTPFGAALRAKSSQKPRWC